MKRAGWLHAVVIALTSFGIATPHTLFAGDAKPAITRPAAGGMTDLALAEGGLLTGQVVNPQGAPVARASVAVWQQNVRVATVETNERGQFAVPSLRGGVYQLHSSGATGVYRAWSPSTSPPSARQHALLVAGQDVVRGQEKGPVMQFLTNPWVLAGLVGAAIAVPIALSNHDQSSSS